jgi:hypothetical protein
MRKLITGLALSLSLLATSASAGYIPVSYTDADGDIILDDGSEGWTLSDLNLILDDSGFEMVFQSGLINTSFHNFGIYQFDAGTDTMLDSLTVFQHDTVGSASNLVWNILGLSASTQYGSMSLATGVGAEFGFWFESDGFTSYSHSVLNAGSEDFFGFYWNDDPYDVWNLAVSGSDNDLSGNLDYMQVEISDVARVGPDTQSFTEVPEPGSLALMSMAMLGFGFSRRKAKA